MPNGHQRAAADLGVDGAREAVADPRVGGIAEHEHRVGHGPHQIKLHDGSGMTRGKPAGVAGAAVFSYVGTTPPASTSEWVFQETCTRTKVDVVFDSSLVPGATVWLTAFWYNAKAQSGPPCTPISTTFGAAGVSTSVAA